MKTHLYRLAILCCVLLPLTASVTQAPPDAATQVYWLMTDCKNQEEWFGSYAQLGEQVPAMRFDTHYLRGREESYADLRARLGTLLTNLRRQTAP